MITLLNYSHPLSLSASIQLGELVGEFDEKLIECKIDFSLPIERQLIDLVFAGSKLIRNEYNILYIPPALSFVAAYVTCVLSQTYSSLRMVVLKAAPGPLREYVISDVIDL